MSQIFSPFTFPPRPKPPLYYSLLSHFPSPSLQRKSMETLIPEISKLLNETLSPDQSILVSATESLDRLSSQLPAFPLSLIAIASGIHPLTSIHLLPLLDFISIPLYLRFLNLYSLLDLKKFSIVSLMLIFVCLVLMTLIRLRVVVYQSHCTVLVFNSLLFDWNNMEIENHTGRSTDFLGFQLLINVWMFNWTWIDL